MPVVMLIAILVVLAGVVAVAVGRGGELSHEEVDHAPLDLGPMSATDIVLLRPPTVLWGYSPQVTDEALERIAGAIRDRDVRIVALEQRIVELTGHDDYGPPSTARHARRNQQLSDAGFFTAVAEPPVIDPDLSAWSEPGSGSVSVADQEPAPPPAPEHEEQDTVTGEAAAWRVAAEGQPAPEEITNDRSDE